MAIAGTQIERLGLKHLIAALLMFGVPMGLIMLQPDLGTALLVGVSGAFVIFLGGIGWPRILMLVGSAAAAAPIAWEFMHEYQRNRIRMFLDPEADPLGNGWNIIQAKIAVGSGGLVGNGIGQSQQKNLFLPEAHTDFILAIVGELPRDVGEGRPSVLDQDIEKCRVDLVHG